MKKITLLLIVSSLFYFSGIAQTASVKGVITDTINKQNLSNTVISLLRPKDSVLVKFGRSNDKGGFEIKNLKAGDYLLLVTYPEYADYIEPVKITDSSALNLGTINIILKANLLQDVIVKQQVSAIKMKGDTTEFTADSFKVQANASVEDLLKKIPSIQIDKDGKITAQGVAVQKVLVDGEEFFGDDPTLVTQNLRADIIDKVQIFDKKSEQAAFTGIDDGEKTKTINLKIKDGKKNGYFGKLSLSGGTDGYHDNQAMLNIFKNKWKFAAYGIVSNTGKTGLNWQDQSSYGDNSNSGVMFDGGMMMISGGGSDDDIDSWSGQYNGQGYPLVQTGGLHYNTKFGLDDKQSINGNYKLMNLMVLGSTTTNSQNVLSHDTINYTNDYQKFTNRILRNRANGTYEVQFDSSSSMKITADGGTDHKITNSSDSSESYTNNDLVNRSKRNLSTIGDKSTVNSNLIYRKKFKKVGRTLSFDINEKYSNNVATGYLYSVIDTFRNNTSGRLITDQYKTENSRNISFDTKLTYTEPLSKASSLVLNYGVVVNNSNSERNSYNKTDQGKYTSIDSVYSNHYQFNVFTNRTGIAYNYSKKKVRFNLGGNIGFTNFNQTNLHTDSVANRRFTDLYPQANFTYSFSQQRRLSFYYSGNTQQPSILQIQPVATNDDPLNITVGNPNLKAAFSNQLSLNFFDFKVLTSRNIFAGINYNFTENAIESSSTFDAYGKRVNQYVNLNGNNNLSGYISYGIKMKKLDAFVNFNGNVNAGRNVNIVNGQFNVTNSDSYSGRIGLYKDKEKKYNLNFNVGATYTTNISSIQPDLKTNYWTYQIQPNVDVYLPLKLQIHADGSYDIRQKTPIFTSNNNVFILNAWFGRKLLKNDALVVKISGNDILNQNIGFQRQVQSNFITQTTNSTISRFFLLSAVWNFTKAGTTAPRQMF